MNILLLLYAGEFGDEYGIKLNIGDLNILNESDCGLIERICKIYKEIK